MAAFALGNDRKTIAIGPFEFFAVDDRLGLTFDRRLGKGCSVWFSNVAFGAILLKKSPPDKFAPV
jgi:hypothetical protein